MNPKIYELKIKGYRKKLEKEYDFLGIKEIYHGVEGKKGIAFMKVRHPGEIYHYSIYDSETHEYKDIELKYKVAMEKLKKNLDIFKCDEYLTFVASYYDSGFRIKCKTEKFIEHFDRIKCLYEQPIIYNEDRKIYMSLSKYEYELELIISDYRYYL